MAFEKKQEVVRQIAELQHLNTSLYLGHLKSLSSFPCKLKISFGTNYLFHTASASIENNMVFSSNAVSFGSVRILG